MNRVSRASANGEPSSPPDLAAKRAHRRDGGHNKETQDKLGLNPVQLVQCAHSVSRIAGLPSWQRPPLKYYRNTPGDLFPNLVVLILEFPRDVSHIHRLHPLCTPLQQAIGKSTG